MEQASLSLREVMEMAGLPQERLLCGGPPEGVAVCHAAVLEPPAGDFVREGELVLTTALGCDGTAALCAFLRELHEKGAAAVALSFEDPARRVPEEALALARARGLALLLLPWELRFSELIEGVLTRLRARREGGAARWEGLQARLLGAYLSGAPLNAALALLAEETGCAVLLTDGAGCALGATAPLEGADWRLLLPVPLLGEEAGALLLAGERATPAYLDALAAGSPFLLTPLLLWLDRAEVRGAARGRLREELVRAQAEGTLPDTADNRARARMLGLRPGEEARCLAAALDGWDARGRAALRGLLRTQTAFPAALTAEAAVLYLPPDEPPERAADALGRSLSSRALPALRWGCSDCGRDRAALYRQALYGARLCAREGGARVYRPEDAVLARLLDPCRSDEAARAAAHALLAPLWAHDEAHGGGLLPALRGYFACGGNVCEGARTLHLHRQTLRQRLLRAEELLGFSLRERRRALALELALLLCEP